MLGLGGNELGGTITGDIVVFTKLTGLGLAGMNLQGAVCSSAPPQTRIEKRFARAGPPLPETLQLLAPLAPTLEKLHLGGNKLGGTITDDIAAFTGLTEPFLAALSLSRGRVC